MIIKKILVHTTKPELLTALRDLIQEIEKWENDDVDGIGSIVTVTISQRDRK